MVDTAKASFDKIQRLLREEEDREDSESLTNVPVIGNGIVNHSWTGLSKMVQDEKNLSALTLAKDPEIDIFHNKLQNFVDNYGLMRAPSLEEFSDLATEYSVQMDHMRMQTKDLKHQMNGSQAKVAEQEKRTERDFWTLLQVLSISDVMGIVDKNQCQAAYDHSIALLSPLVTIPDYLNTAFAEDLRFKKTKVVKDWLENAYRDQVIDAPASKSPPMFETWLSIQQQLQHQGKNMDIVRGRSQLSHIHADSQFHSAGLLTLVGSDQQDQDAMLFCIWQLVRSGQIDCAQRKAYENQAYWLASSLRGCDPHWYSLRDVSQPDEDNEDDYRMAGDALRTIVRRGNVRHSLSMKNAYLYADRLLQSQQKKGVDVQVAPYATMLEMSIFGAMANHVEALRASDLISTWSDRLWVYVNGVYNRDLVKIYDEYYSRKSQHSKLYPGCDDHSMANTRWLVTEFSKSVQGNIDEEIAVAVPPPRTRNLECILRQLQIAFLGGVRSIQQYFEENLLDLIDPTETYPGYDHVLRIVVHVLLWCSLRPTMLNAALDQIVSQEMYFHTLEIYIGHLIDKMHYEKVALYARFLSPHRRVVAYARLLLAIQSDHVQPGHAKLSREERDALSRVTLALAQEYFPEDVPDITRTVMEDSSRGPQPPVSKRQRFLEGNAAVGSLENAAASSKPQSTSSSSSKMGLGFTNGPNFGSSARSASSSSSAAAVVDAQPSHISASSSALVAVSGTASGPTTSSSSSHPLTDADRLVLESLRWVVLESSSQQSSSSSSSSSSFTANYNNNNNTLAVAAVEEGANNASMQGKDVSAVTEVLRAVHRVVAQLLTSSNMDKVSLLPIVMDNYATEEIIVRADQRLEHWRIAYERSKMHRQSHLQSHNQHHQQQQQDGAVMESLVAIYEKQWRNDKDLYSLWQGLRLIYQRREEWIDCLRWMHREQSQSLGHIDRNGRHRPSQAMPPMALFHRLRELVLDQLLPLIENMFVTSFSSENNDEPGQGGVEGIVTVLQSSMEIAEEVSRLLLDSVWSDITSGQKQTTAGLPSSSSSSLAVILKEQTLLSADRAKDDQHLIQQIRQALSEISSQLDAHSKASTLFNVTHTESKKQLLMERFGDIQKFFAQMSGSASSHSAAVLQGDVLLRIFKTLQVVSLRLKDIVETTQLLSLLVYYLLQMYLSLCLKSNEALSIYDSLTDTGIWEARNEILVRAFKMTDMIAHESATLSLYRFLSTEQLEAVLQDIGTAAFYLLPNGPGSLSVESPQLS